jgi:8-oxo-dGTP diphosphatase
MECAAPLQQQDQTSYTCSNEHRFYNNPKANVTAILRKGDQVLMVRRSNEPGKGKYDFPGGFINFGEAPEAALVREMQEELSITPKAYELLSVHTVEYLPEVSACVIIYQCTDWDGDIVMLEEGDSLRWQPISELSDDMFPWVYEGLLPKLSITTETSSP